MVGVISEELLCHALLLNDQIHALDRDGMEASDSGRSLKRNASSDLLGITDLVESAAAFDEAADVKKDEAQGKPATMQKQDSADEAFTALAEARAQA